jgi:hypothetical protein
MENMMTTFPTRIKVLQLEYWMTVAVRAYERRTSDDDSFIGPAIIGKDAWYYDATGVSWFEFEGNSYATKGLVEDFKYKLKLLNTVLLSANQENDMEKLLNTLPKSQSEVMKSLRKVLYDHYQVKRLRTTGRKTRKMFLKAR